MEVWKTIQNSNGCYAVSSNGRIKRIKPGNHETRVGKILHQYTTRKGYKFCGLYINKKTKLRSIHSLVLESFHSPRPFGYVANHKNGIKDDNRIENLEWCTWKQNSLHSTRILHNQQGENSGRAKLKNKDIFKIRELFKNGMKKASIARHFNVSQTNIKSILIRKIWNHI